MKKHKIIGLALLSSIVMNVSCSDFLDVPVESNISTSNFFQSTSDFEMALTGVYNTLTSAETANNDRYGNYFFGFLFLGRIGTDEMYTSYGDGDITNIGSYAYTTDNLLVSRVWYMMYRGIQRASVVIDRMASSGENLSDSDQDRILGEAHFLRGFFYFHLVRLYGEVPLVVNETTDINDVNTDKASVEEVYAQIIKDLSLAEEKLSIDYVQGHAHKYAAKALLGKVYLQMSGYPLNDTAAAATAALYFDEVINSGKFSLIEAANEDDYFSIFTPEMESGPEAIWSVEFSDADGTNSYGGQVGTVEGVQTPNNLYWSQVRATQEFYETFDENDGRRNAIARFKYVYDTDGVTLVKEDNSSTTRYSAYKFRHALTEEERGSTWANWSNPINFPIIRYSDVLLCYAEAINRSTGAPTAEALECVNMVRRRGYYQDSQTTDPSLDYVSMTQSDFDTVLLNERSWELCFEGHRWFDLVRFNVLEEYVKRLSVYSTTTSFTSQAINIKPKHYNFPIPQNVIDASNGMIEQNPDWL